MSSVASDTLVAVALSGGVDSAVAAALLQQQGYRLIGLTMTLLPDSDATTAAQQVADHLGIPLHRIDMTAVFDRQVITPFAVSYLNGETPNPCVRCNRLIKFGQLLDEAHRLGATMLATGHYARISRDTAGQPHLLAAADRRKDQSYFLGWIGPEALEQVLFPLGELSGKDEVRQLARQFGLPVAERKESQDVCFLPESGYVPFLAAREGANRSKGLIVHRNGSLLGRHNGFWQYTIGQRKGLGIAWKEPLYVLELQSARNRVVVGEEPYLYAPGLVAEEMRWFGTPPQQPFAAACKIRYRHAPVACRVEPRSDDAVQVIFDEPQRAITPGQTLAVYRGDEVLGAGRIVEALPQC